MKTGSGKRFTDKKAGYRSAGDKRAISELEVELLSGQNTFLHPKSNGKVRKLALTRALVDHAADGAISLIEEWAISSHKTKDINGLLNAIGAQKSVLIISDSIDQNLFLLFVIYLKPER